MLSTMLASVEPQASVLMCERTSVPASVLASVLEPLMGSQTSLLT